MNEHWIALLGKLGIQPGADGQFTAEQGTAALAALDTLQASAKKAPELEAALAAERTSLAALKAQTTSVQQGAQVDLGQYVPVATYNALVTQVAALTQDIIWLEEEEHMGRKVLVPHLYLASATQQESDLSALVARNAEYQAQAQQALDEDTARYNELMAEEQSIQAELTRRAAADLARGGGRDIGAMVAAGTVWTDHTTYPLVANGPQVALSPQGFIRPVDAKPGSPFGRRFHPILKIWRMHNGTDFGATCGMPLYAAQSGTVVTAGRQGGFGNYVVVDHGVIGGASLMTGYAHQSKIAVSVGQHVNAGQLIGYVGTTGLSTGCHLHLQVYKNGTPVDPLTYIP